jgi:16S rRNA (cytidine1402-2'-O)-methyltransferase
MGTLYIIATPIGNLEDFTFRALRLLREEVNAIFCEDTRQTRKLLVHYGIDLPSYPIHSHSTEAALERALSLLAEGKTIAYTTDCGTPAVSDPGSRLVEAARSAGHIVSPIPGASALTALASVSGFPGKHLLFAGFLSKKEGRRRRELEELKQIKGIIIIYESPHRIKKALASIAVVFPHERIILGREMTKMFEEFISGTAAGLLAESSPIREKGEFAIAIDNTRGENCPDDDDRDDMDKD